MEKIAINNVKLMPGTTADLSELGIQAHSAPKQQQFATYEGRLRTFQDWPKHLNQTPEMLATAGFYYVGKKRCPKLEENIVHVFGKYIFTHYINSQ